MINSVTELKDLIVWAKSQGIKSLHIGDISFELSNYALIEQLSDEASAPEEPVKKPTANEQGLDELVTSGERADDEEALYWSSRT